MPHDLPSLPPLEPTGQPDPSARPLPPTDMARTQMMPAGDFATQDDAERVVGGFVLVKRLGAGAMGEVHLARHRADGREAALKLVTNKLQADESYQKRFIRECELLSRLDHPNIAKALDHGVDNGCPWLAMEFVRGDNLDDILKARGRLTQSEVLHVAIQVARGLDHAYGTVGLIHRDIKPANIILAKSRADSDTSDDQAKIIDFGLAKESSTNDQHLTMSGVILGTPHYMSPEQIRCEDELTFATDLYALGATMFHLLTGRVPFPKPSPAGVLSAHLTEPVPNPGDIQPGLNPIVRQIVRRCLAKGATERFPDYRSFIVECGKAMKALGVRLDGTVRIVRRRVGSTNEPGTEKQTHPTVALPHPPQAEKPATKPKGTGSSSFRPTPHLPAGADPLTIISGRIAREQKPMTGSEALRRETTAKFKHLSTTQRIRRRQQANRELLGPEVLAPEPFVLRSRAAQVRTLLPWLMLGLSLVALMVLVVLGE
jgi:serine/threonine-protein kinase